MTTDISDFTENFASLLIDREQLEPVAPIYGGIASVFKHDDKADPLRADKLRFSIEHPEFKIIAAITVNVRVPGRLYIFSLNSRMSKKAPRGNLGRELLRRAVWYAHLNGFQKIETYYFGEKHASFWLGMGFRSKGDVDYYWKTATPDEAREWKPRLAASPDEIWNLARTEVGRRVLVHEVGPGVLDLTDEAQRRYAFHRLMLPDSQPS